MTTQTQPKPGARGARARRIAAALAGALLVGGCDSFLETSPMGALNDQTFYRTQRDFEGATLGAYSTLLNYAWDQEGRGLFQGVHLTSDDVRCRPGGPGCNDDQFVWTATNQNFSDFWRESYKGIMRANMVLRGLPHADAVAQEEKDRFEGEARFLRAYFYFFLARHFADPDRPSIPLVTEVASALDDAYRDAVPTAEVWDQIEADLVFAAQNLPEKTRWVAENQVGRASRGAANALLGKVRLYRAQWLDEPEKYQGAISALEAVVQSGQYGLVQHFQHNFLETHQNNEESIFEVQMSEGTDINGWDPVDSGFGSASYSRDIAWGPGCWQGECEPWGGGRSYGILHVNPGLHAAFETVTVGGETHEDARRYYTALRQDERLYSDPDSWIPMFQAAWSPTGSTPAKYVKPMLLDTYVQNRFHVNDYNNDRLIRYADVLLMLAEARLLGNGDAGGAAQLVNQVRQRARQTYQELHGQAPPAGLLADLGSVTHADIRQERRVELALEGHRYDDLVRWHRAGLIDIAIDVDFGYSEPNSNWQPRHLLKPIPRAELDRNPRLTQNQGY